MEARDEWYSLRAIAYESRQKYGIPLNRAIIATTPPGMRWIAGIMAITGLSIIVDRANNLCRQRRDGTQKP